MRHLKFILILFFFSCQSVVVASPIKSTLQDQKDVQVTVYNSNFGLIKDQRTLTLPKGEGELRFMDVASHIEPVSVQVRSLTDPDDLHILEQNYEYDLISEQKLLDKYVGKDLKIIRFNEYQDRKETVDATLISNHNGQVYRIEDEIYLGYPGTRILPEIPGNLIEKPTLTWQFASSTNKAQNIEVTYLTQNLGWKADYVLTVAKDDASLDLSGWVTIDNKSGATYQDAQLQLIAGDVQRVRQQYRNVRKERVMMAASMQRDAAFEQEAFFDYHIYDLKRKTTIKDNQTKQISFVEASNVSVEKAYRVYGKQGFYGRIRSGQAPTLPVSTHLIFENAKTNQLGMPLPAGVLRFYKKDSKGRLQFIGEDRITHTPKDEEIEVKLGNAFDLKAERRQMDFQQKSKQLYESEWEITLRNHKDEAVTIEVIEPMPGSWKVLRSSHDFEKKDASTIQFDVKVAPDKEVKVTYRVQTGI